MDVGLVPIARACARPGVRGWNQRCEKKHMKNGLNQDERSLEMFILRVLGQTLLYLLGLLLAP